jgi:hypothetical protein
MSDAQEAPKKLTAAQALERIGPDRALDFLFEAMGTAGILHRMTEHLAHKRKLLQESENEGERKQAVRANRMHQILLDASKRADLI